MLKKIFIGFYNRANVVTLLGLASAVTAVFCAGAGKYAFSCLLLLLTGVCDAFDGKIARSLDIDDRKVRVYGVNIDSLADCVSFGVAPVMIAYNMGFKGVADNILYLLFILCGAIRLAYFNTQALSSKDLSVPYFTGVPIPVSCLIMPPLVLLTALFEPNITVWIFRLFFLVCGLAFICRVQIKKPQLDAFKGTLIAGGEVLIVVILFFANLKTNF